MAENLQAQYSAIKMLASRVRLIAEYVKASQRGEVEFNHEILRQVNALAHRLPVLNSEKFRGEFYNVSPFNFPMTLLIIQLKLKQLNVKSYRWNMFFFSFFFLCLTFSL